MYFNWNYLEGLTFPGYGIYFLFKLNYQKHQKAIGIPLHPSLSSLSLLSNYSSMTLKQTSVHKRTHSFSLTSAFMTHTHRETLSLTNKQIHKIFLFSSTHWLLLAQGSYCVLVGSYDHFPHWTPPPLTVAGTHRPPSQQQGNKITFSYFQ